MGDSCLRCLDCQGKFGAICSDLRCALCGTLFRLKALVLSERFPPGAGHFAEVTLRDTYFKVLEEGEAKAAQDQGGKEEQPPGEIDKSPLEAKPVSPLQTTPMARPAVKGELSEVKEKEESEALEVKEPAERASSSHRPKDKPKHKKRHHRRSEEEEERRGKRKKVRSRTPGRSHSQTLRVREGEVFEERPPLRRNPERKERDRPRDSRDRGRAPRGEGREGRSERARSPLRPRSPLGPPPNRAPRSPLGPPPPRSPPRRWVGPIPAGGRPHYRQEDWEKKAENKGVKKRKQQALFAEFKAWRKRNRRW